MAFAPEDPPKASRFDAVGAVILAAALGALAWALSRIGPGGEGATDASSLPSIAIIGGLSVVGLAVYAFWERRTEHPMTPPRLVANRAFVGLNVATLLIYAGLSIMFFLMPFDLVDRRGLSATGAGLVLCPSRSASVCCRGFSAPWRIR